VAELWAPLTSFVGRDHEVAELGKLVRGHRLVTVTGPGGVGKTRMATEVARSAASQFPDGVYFVGLGALADGARVPEEVAAALGVPQAHGRSSQEVLAEVLAPRRLLLVLDNCEHVLTAAAELCGSLLNAADEVSILATSREQLWVGGEARYRLSPLALPKSADAADMDGSEAVALFAERARQADPQFTLDPESLPMVAQVVARLDGMPLAIELAAARAGALGMAGLASRIDGALGLLNSRDLTAATRHESLAAVADWSYRLLSPSEQQAFRRLAAFPGPFTLEAAEAVAGPEAGPTVLRLVDCSLLTPPRAGPDQRMRYGMLQTLRAYGQDQLSAAGEEQQAAEAVAMFALSVAEQASAGSQPHDRELDAIHWLDAEDATVNWALSWALEHAPDEALRMAVALGPWWRLHGRMAEGYGRLASAVSRASAASAAWGKAQLWLGYLSRQGLDNSARYAAAYAAGDPRVSVDALVANAFRRLNYGQAAEADDDARRALALALDAGYAAGQAQAQTVMSLLSLAGQHPGARAEALDWARRAQESLTADTPGWLARWCRITVTHVLIEAGELGRARQACAGELAQSRTVGDLTTLTSLLSYAVKIEWLTGDMTEVRSHIHEAAGIASRIGDHTNLYFYIDQCALVCAATGHPAEAITLWAAVDAERERAGSLTTTDKRELRRQAVEAISPEQVRMAAKRGARMTPAAAVEFIVMVTERQQPSQPPEGEATASAIRLTERERDLVTLVAEGRTNAQIAATLSISIRTVTSHLDRIRDKTGYRRRADLTRLALSEGLV
jgi:non-specific serine/threonine protein kinase